MGSEVFFFATKADLQYILQAVEAEFDTQYFKCGIFSSVEGIKQFDSMLDYADLGINKSGNHQSPSFLLMDKADTMVPERHIFSSGTKFSVSQFGNPYSVDVWPGGIYHDAYLMHGHVATIHMNEKTKRMMNAFRKAVRKRSVAKKNRYYVCEDGMDLYGKMPFITIEAGENPGCDLKL